jgi:lipopolysaccharide export LptBFGC system permease protein LptF
LTKRRRSASVMSVDLPTLTWEAILWLGVPPAASIVVAVAGLYTRRRTVGVTLLFIGVLGLILSVLWFLLVLRVEAVVK